MITKVEAYTANLLATAFPLSGDLANNDPVQIRNIEGLGPVKAEVVSSSLATGRGAFYQGKSTGTRNIVITLGLNPNWIDQTVASLRHMLYQYFMPEQWTKLRFFTDDLPVVNIEGIVESLEPNIFSQDPEMQVSIICHQPDFVDPEAVIIEGLVPNSLTDGAPSEQEFVYEGSVPSGFELRVKSTVAKPDYTGRLIVVTQAPVNYEVFDIDPVTIDATKYFNLTTVKSRRRVETINSDASRNDVLADMVDTSVWSEFKPGDNIFSVGAEESGLAWTLIYFNRFGGL